MTPDNLTSDVNAFVAEGWVLARFDDLDPVYKGAEDVWLPTLMKRRQTQKGLLASTFVGIIEPYEKESNISSIHRLPLETSQGQLYPDSYTAVAIQLKNGCRDLLITADVENPLALQPAWQPGSKMIQKDWGIRFDGQLCWLRLDAAGNIQRIAVSHGTELYVANVALHLVKETDFIEIGFEDKRASVVSGSWSDVEKILINKQDAVRVNTKTRL